jgi:hypothetical protein
MIRPRMQPPILVLAREDSPNRFAGYVAEMLRVEGLNWFETASSLPATPPPLVVAAATAVDAATAERLAAHVRAGGALVACRPAAAVLSALDLPPAPLLPEEWSDRYVVLEGDSPITRALPWVEGGVQFFGRPLALVADPPRQDLQVVARFAPFPGQPSRYAAATAHTIGAGRVVLFAFDPAESIVRQQQGRPEQASTGPLADFDGDGTYRPNDLFFGQLDSALRDVPQADLQRTLLVRAIEWLTESRPLPRLWRFPHSAPAAALFDGDSDAMDLHDFRGALELCDRHGAPFATYLTVESLAIVDAAEEAAARARGHQFGPHPWAGPQPAVAELGAALEANCAAFAAQYGYRPRVHRGHWLVWPGYVDHARSLQGAGIELDANFTAGFGFKGGYVNGTGLPARFVDEDGRLLDVYEQATVSTDDGWLLPKGGLPAMTLAEAISRSCAMIDAAVERYHTVYHPYFHPRPLKGGGTIPYPTRPWLDAVLAHARRRGLPYLNAERWLDWNATRRTIALTSLTHSRRGVACTLRADRGVHGVAVLLPAPYGAAGEQIVTRHGRPYAAVTVDLPAGAEVEVEVGVALSTAGS